MLTLTKRDIDEAAAEWLRQALVKQAPPSVDYAVDPVGFIREKLGGFPWSKQIEIAESVRDHRRTAVHSAHAVGKSQAAAWLVGWWLDSHKPGEAFVVTTAPTASQVRAVLWRYIRRAHQSGNLAGHTNQTEWFIGDELVAFGRKPSDYDPSAFQGIHSLNILVILDEAGGIPTEIYQSAASLAANERGRILAIGNPDDPQSHFATVCKPGSGWHVIRVNGLESPNFTGENVPDSLRELLIGPTYVAETLADGGGEDSPLYVSKVLGLFPENASDGVVLLSWVRACQRLEAEPGLPVELGMDVGAGGDETNLRERRGMRAGRKWNKKTPDFGDAVAMALDAIRETGATRIKVDAIGIGWGVVGRLAELRQEGIHNCEVVPVNVGAASFAPERFPRLRDQLWWEVGRELSRSGGWDLTDVDETTIAQLIAPKYTRDSAGRIKIEPKAETRKALGRSPDDGDSLLLAYANVAGPAEEIDEYTTLPDDARVQIGASF